MTTTRGKTIPRIISHTHLSYQKHKVVIFDPIYSQISELSLVSIIN